VLAKKAVKRATLVGKLPYTAMGLEAHGLKGSNFKGGYI